LGNLKRFLFL